MAVRDKAACGVVYMSVRKNDPCTKLIFFIRLVSFVGNCYTDTERNGQTSRSG